MEVFKLICEVPLHFIFQGDRGEAVNINIWSYLYRINGYTAMPQGPNTLRTRSSLNNIGYLNLIRIWTTPLSPRCTPVQGNDGDDIE